MVFGIDVYCIGWHLIYGVLEITRSQSRYWKDLAFFSAKNCYHLILLFCMDPDKPTSMFNSQSIADFLTLNVSCTIFKLTWLSVMCRNCFLVRIKRTRWMRAKMIKKCMTWYFTLFKKYTLIFYISLNLHA